MNYTDLPITLSLYFPSHRGGGYERDVTNNLKTTWKRSIRSTGGFWLGKATWEGSDAEMLDLFQNGLQYEIRESAQGITTWEGFISEMYLRYNGVDYYRSWVEISNRIKAIYSKIGENLIDNPGVESAAWTSYNSPTTNARSTAWATQGSYSDHIVGNSVGDGVTIDSSITITAGKAYSARITVNIISGTWRFEIYDTSGGEVIDSVDQATAGQSVIYANVPDTNSYTSVGLRLYITGSSGECYADAAVFQLAPIRAETSWYDDSNSQEQYGVIEKILLQAGMTDDAANALATTTLYKNAWGKTKLDRLTEIQAPEDRRDNKLQIVFTGYIFTLGNKYTLLTGSEDAADNLIASLLDESDFLNSGFLQTNSLNFRVEDREAYNSFDLFRDIVAAGDSSGNRWTGGVYENKNLVYEQASSLYAGRLRNGNLLDNGGGMLQGWFARPGLILLEDIPAATGTPTGRGEDDYRVSWVDEIEFSLGDWLETGYGIRFKKTAI